MSRISFAVLIAVFTIAVAGCGASSTTDRPAQDASGAAVTGSGAGAGTNGTGTGHGADAALCDTGRTTGTYVGYVLEPTTIMTSRHLGRDLATARDHFASITPPPELTRDWTNVARFLRMIAEAYAGVDGTDPAQLHAAQAKLTRLGTSFSDAYEKATTSGKRINAYLGTQCHISSGPGGIEACALLEDSDLRAVFPGTIPEPESSSLGSGLTSCAWEIDNDDMHADDFTVAITLVPIEIFTSEYLAKSTPIGDVSGIENGHSYDGVIKLTGGSTRGHSVSFSKGDQGGFVGVQKGKHGDPDTELRIATSFAKQVLAQL